MTPVNTHDGGPVRQLARPETAVDDLNLSEAVLGDGLMLGRQGSGELTIHTIDGGRASLLGSFASAADAWRALDELDAPVELDQAA
jgi:hypothetical protein